MFCQGLHGFPPTFQRPVGCLSFPKVYWRTECNPPGIADFDWGSRSSTTLTDKRLKKMICVMMLFAMYNATHTCHLEIEYATKDGHCCRFPEPGRFVVQNCTATEGIQSDPCSNCPGGSIVANCTYFSDTQCKNNNITAPPPPESSSFRLELTASFLVLALIFSMLLLYWFSIRLNYRRSPWMPYLPHCLSTFLRYQMTNRNSEGNV